MEILKTNRLLLRSWQNEDLDDFFELCSNATVAKNAGWKPLKDKSSSKEILQRIINHKETWAIVLMDQNKAIGSIGLHNDKKRNVCNTKSIAYSLAQEYWGKGFMTEALKRVIKYSFEELKLELLSVSHFSFNTRSKRVIDKCGFIYEGTLKAASTIYDGTIHDDICYSLHRLTYLSSIC